MNELETIEGEVVEELTQALEVRPEQQVTLFGSEDPVEIVEKATRLATVLADVLKKQELTTVINKREHVRVEGWTFLGTMLGVFPVCVWTKQLSNGWEARVEARTRDGAVVGAAEAECLSSENTWKNRDDYAIRSMAQTRATSKALRQPLGFVVSLAGFDPTPLEEMPLNDSRGLADQHPTGSTQSSAALKQSRAPKSWAEVGQYVGAFGETVTAAWPVYQTQAMALLFEGGEPILKEDKDRLWRVGGKAAQYLVEQHDPNELPSPTRNDIEKVWALSLKEALGVDYELAGPEWRMDATETDRPERES
jgi:hypothetical protein